VAGIEQIFLEIDFFNFFIELGLVNVPVGKKRSIGNKFALLLRSVATKSLYEKFILQKVMSFIYRY
jgi:hypothetical protein